LLGFLKHTGIENHHPLHIWRLVDEISDLKAQPDTPRIEKTAERGVVTSTAGASGGEAAAAPPPLVTPAPHSRKTSHPIGVVRSPEATGKVDRSASQELKTQGSGGSQKRIGRSSFLHNVSRRLPPPSLPCLKGGRSGEIVGFPSPLFSGVGGGSQKCLSL